MNKWLLLLPLCCTIFVSSCTGPKEANESCVHIDLVPVLEKGELPKVKLTDWAKSTRYVQLETNDSILIKHINRIYFYNNRILIQHGNRLSLFDKDGKYLFDPAKHGGGPDEFASNRETRANEHLIYVEDSPTRIKTYDWEGNFKGTIPLPDKDIYCFLPLPDKNIILGHRTNRNGSQPARLYFCQDTTVIDSIPNYKTYPQPKFGMQMSNEFEPLCGTRTLGFKEIFNDTVYQIKNDRQLIPYAIVNLGEYGVNPERRYTLTLDDLKNNIDDIWQGKRIMLPIGDVGEGFYMREHKIKNGETFYYDRKEQQAKGVRLLISDNEQELPKDNFFIPINTSDDNKYLIGWEQPENDNNPVVIFVEPY